MTKKAISLFIPILLAFFGCKTNYAVDGPQVEPLILQANDLKKAVVNTDSLQSVLEDINCAVSGVFNKRLVLAGNYASADTSEILVVPFVPNGESLKSSAYANISRRFILIDPVYIRAFTSQNTLNDSSSYQPLLELMLLHEVGHFILGKEGAFDVISGGKDKGSGQQTDNTQPEYITSIKKIELSADSLAIFFVKRLLKAKGNTCHFFAMDIERIVPGMQFQMSGRRMIDNFGARDIGFLHDPTPDHPNMELRITYMNYFLFPNDSLKQMIDNYIYDRTVAPVHRQELDPRIFQGQEKKLSN